MSRLVYVPDRFKEMDTDMLNGDWLSERGHEMWGRSFGIWWLNTLILNTEDTRYICLTWPTHANHSENSYQEPKIRDTIRRRLSSPHEPSLFYFAHKTTPGMSNLHALKIWPLFHLGTPWKFQSINLIGNSAELPIGIMVRFGGAICVRLVYIPVLVVIELSNCSMIPAGIWCVPARNLSSG